VRAANILRKAGECPAPTAETAGTALAADELWQLLMLASQAMSAAEQSLLASEPAVLAKYAFQLAQAFNTFYHRHHILREEDPGKQAFLLWLAGLVRRQLLQALAWLGIEVPEVM
jgi:arginyl-tRNA synthetase